MSPLAQTPVIGSLRPDIFHGAKRQARRCKIFLPSLNSDANKC